MLEGEWSAFNKILNKKNDSLASQIPSLQLKIIEEEKIIHQRIKDLINDWNNSKPLAGNIKYTTALETLKIFEGRISKVKGDYERVQKAKLALEIQQGLPDDQLKSVEEEIHDLTSVWNELSSTWKVIEQLKETPWTVNI